MSVALKVPQTTLLGSCTAAQWKQTEKKELLFPVFFSYFKETGEINMESKGVGFCMTLGFLDFV